MSGTREKTEFNEYISINESSLIKLFHYPKPQNPKTPLKSTATTNIKNILKTAVLLAHTTLALPPSILRYTITKNNNKKWKQR